MKPLLIFIALLSLFSINCTNIPSPKNAAEDVVRLFNERDYNNLWGYVSEDSRGKITVQLNDNKANPIGRNLISNAFSIPPESIDTLTTQGYFVAILNSVKTTEILNMKIENLEVKDELAYIYWTTNQDKGTLSMIFENGKWMFLLDSVAGHNE
ncbi:MAG: hypothetical protein ABUK01_06760 [Leptospirales bacterium]